MVSAVRDINIRSMFLVSTVRDINIKSMFLVRAVRDINIRSMFLVSSVRDINTVYILEHEPLRKIHSNFDIYYLYVYFLALVHYTRPWTSTWWHCCSSPAPPAASWACLHCTELKRSLASLPRKQLYTRSQMQQPHKFVVCES